MPSKFQRVGLAVEPITMEWLSAAAKAERRSVAGMGLILIADGLASRFPHLNPKMLVSDLHHNSKSTASKIPTKAVTETPLPAIDLRAKKSEKRTSILVRLDDAVYNHIKELASTNDHSINRLMTHIILLYCKSPETAFIKSTEIEKKSGHRSATLIRVDNDVYSHIKERAKSNGRTVNNLVTHLITAYSRNHQA